MPISALFIVDDLVAGDQSPLLLKLAGQSMLERMVRQCMAAGSVQTFVFGESLPTEIVAICDRLSRDGIKIAVVKSAHDLADRIHPEEAIIFFDSLLLIDQRWFNHMAADRYPELLVVPKDAGARFERVDGEHHWAGLGRVSGTILREVLTDIGDWALAPTLLRRAVQIGAQRMPLDITDYDAIRPADADEFAATRVKALKISTDAQGRGLSMRAINHYVVGPLTEKILTANISSKKLDIISIVLLILGILLQISGFSIWSVLPFVSACVVMRAGVILGRASGANDQKKWPEGMRDFSILSLTLTLAWQNRLEAVGSLLLVLAAWLCVQWLLHMMFRRNQTLVDAPLIALVLGISELAGSLAVGLCLMIAGLVAEQAWAETSRIGTKQ